MERPGRPFRRRDYWLAGSVSASKAVRLTGGASEYPGRWGRIRQFVLEPFALRCQIW